MHDLVLFNYRYNGPTIGDLGKLILRIQLAISIKREWSWIELLKVIIVTTHGTSVVAHDCICEIS